MVRDHQNPRTLADLSHQLDAVRSAAALMVVVFHWARPENCNVSSGILDLFGKAGVLIFFVISGFVIAAITDTRETTCKSYVIARLSRLFSIAIPALICVPMLDYATVRWTGSTAIELPSLLSGFETTAISSVFANEWWFVNAVPFSNSPFWSLSYEAAYYLLFGVFAFGRLHKWWLLGVVALAVGPRVLVLFPIWLSGVAVYYCVKNFNVSRIWSAVICILAACLLLLSSYHVPVEWLGRSRNFISDNVFGCAIAMLFYVAAVNGVMVSGVPRFLKHAISGFAGRSFTVYLFHLPLMFFLCGVAGPLRTTPIVAGAILVTDVTICLMLGSVLEPSKSLWRSMLSRVCARLECELPPSRMGRMH